MTDVLGLFGDIVDFWAEDDGPNIDRTEYLRRFDLRLSLLTSDERIELLSLLNAFQAHIDAVEAS